MISKRWLVEALALGMALIHFKAALALDIAAGGKPQTAIVVPDDATRVVKFAANELQRHIEKASGAQAPIVGESKRPDARGLIYLGPCKETAKAGLSPENLPPNGFIIKLLDGDLFMLGDDTSGSPTWILHNNRERVGTLFAVYEFLEKHLHALWLWPGDLGEVVPKRSEIRVEAWDQTGSPRFIHTRWRDGGPLVAGASGWSSSRARSRYLHDQSVWLRRHRFAMGVNMDMKHAFTYWWERYGQTRKEYFNLLPDGARHSDPTYWGGAPKLIGMCVAEPSFWRAIVEEWRKTRSPGNPYIDASENDTPGKCVCEKCLAWDAPDPDSETPFANRLEFAKNAFEKGDADWYRHLGSLADRYSRFYLAVQKEAQRIDPNATVMGFAYANYRKPPLRTKLNDHIIIGIVPSIGFPWTEERRKAFRKEWDGWAATGARLFLRPNYMLEGHNMPIFFARKLGEDFSYAAAHGMIGDDFDSLTGQWSTQGPNLYVLARAQTHPDWPVDKMLDEYYSGFGPAGSAVREYFAHWEKVSNAVTPEESQSLKLHWARFYRGAGGIFTPEVMARGWELLGKAEKAARGDVTALRRVGFLKKGLKNVELTLSAQTAFEKYKETGDIQSYRRAIEELDAYRRSVEGDSIANMAFLAWAENNTWDRSLFKVMNQPGEKLPDRWKFMWDAANKGEESGWHLEGFDDSQWLDVATNAPWEQQEVGEKWKEEHGRDYNGFAWYRNRFTVKPSDKPQQIRLVFGAVDEAAVVWVNGQLVLRRPYPYRGDRDSWKKAFEVDVTEAARFDRPNTLAVRVEDNAGAGGIWKPVWLVQSPAPAPQEKNAVKNGGFERNLKDWKTNVMCGQFEFAIDHAERHSGSASARITCLALAETEPKRGWTRAWGRWYQTGLAVEPKKTYRMRLWLKTSPDFTGRVAIWAITDKGTQDAKMLNTEGRWKEAIIEGIVPPSNNAQIYLNLMDGVGTVWLDDVELVQTEE